MLLFDCKNEEISWCLAHRQLSETYVKLNYVNLKKNFGNCDKYETLILFGKVYHKGSVLHTHDEELYFLTRKNYQILNESAKSSSTLYNNFESENNEFTQLREDIVSFFYYILKYLKCVESNHDSISCPETHHLLHRLKTFITSFRKLIRSFKDLPEFVIRNSSSAAGNECKLATYHLFHLHLELLWLIMLIKCKMLTLNKHISLTFVDPKNDVIMEDQQTGENEELLLELKWVIYSLTALSAIKYHMISNQNDNMDKDLFTCDCVKDIWTATQFFSEELSELNHLEHFWQSYNGIFNDHVFTNDTISAVPGAVLKFNPIKCDNSGAFALWQLYNVSYLYGHQKDGTFILNSTRIIPNYELLEKCLKILFEVNSTISEVQLRRSLKQLIHLTQQCWEPRSDIINILWEYFHKRLNSKFTSASAKDSFTAFTEQSITQIASKLQRFLDFDKMNTTVDTSFSMFLHLLGIHLKKYHDLQQYGQCQRIKGRIYPKFTPSKMSTLSEVGLQNFTMLYIIMAISTDVLDVCQKLHNLLTQISFDGLTLNQKCTLIKAHLLVCYFFVTSGSSISSVAKTVLADVNNIANQRDTDSMFLLKNFVEGVLDLVATSQNYQHDEHILIDSWLSRYLSTCSIRDFSHTLEHLNVCLTKLMMASNIEEINKEKMHAALSSHVFSCVKQSFTNGTAVLQVADFSYNFSKMSHNNKQAAKFYGEFDDLIQYFILSESANVNVIRAFTYLCLRDEQLVPYFDSRKRLSCLLIHSWVRCTITCDENHRQENLDLTLLVAQLGEFRRIHSAPCIQDTPQEYICAFIHSIGRLWKGNLTFQDKCRLREEVDGYFKSFDKYVMPSLRQPKTYEATMQIVTAISTLVFHCSAIIYSRAKPTCILHSIVGTILLPTQIFVDSKKLHTYFVNSVCKCWYMIMHGLFQLDCNNDIYIDKTMRDMITQYVPCFAVKTLSNKELYDVPFRMIPSDSCSDLMLEKYIFSKISSIFFACHGKLINVNAVKVLSVVYHTIKTNLTNLPLIELFVSNAFIYVFEQMIFTDAASANRKISSQIIGLIFNNDPILSNESNLKSKCKSIMVELFSKHLAFSSNVLIKAVCTYSAEVRPILKEIIPQIEDIIKNVENLRGVGYDTGLRNGLRELIKASM